MLEEGIFVRGGHYGFLASRAFGLIALSYVSADRVLQFLKVAKTVTCALDGVLPSSWRLMVDVRS